MTLDQLYTTLRTFNFHPYPSGNTHHQWVHRAPAHSTYIITADAKQITIRHYKVVEDVTMRTFPMTAHVEEVTEYLKGLPV